MPTLPAQHRPRARAGKVKRQAFPREGANARGYTYSWQQASKQHLKRHPLCVHCQDKGRFVPATVVDHIIPHKGDNQLFWDRGNWQSLCKPHHDSKTARENGRVSVKRGTYLTQ